MNCYDGAWGFGHNTPVVRAKDHPTDSWSRYESHDDFIDIVLPGKVDKIIPRIRAADDQVHFVGDLIGGQGGLDFTEAIAGLRIRQGPDSSSECPTTDETSSSSASVF